MADEKQDKTQEGAETVTPSSEEVSAASSEADDKVVEASTTPEAEEADAATAAEEPIVEAAPEERVEEEVSEPGEDSDAEDEEEEEDPFAITLPAEEGQVSEAPEVAAPQTSTPGVEEQQPEDLALQGGEADEHEEVAHQPSTPVIEPVHHDGRIDGWAAYFDDPHELLVAAEEARDEGFKVWDAYSPFPIHGIEDAMGIGRSWLPWVTFAAGATGFTLANLLQFGTLSFDWPMIIGGKPYAPWPSFVPIMFELTVLIGGVTSALVMFIAAGCFRRPRIIDRQITNDRFVLWIDAKDPKFGQAREFMSRLDPVEIRPVTF